MTHPAETILDNLQATFESIFNASSPVANVNNTTQDDNTCIVTSGEYVSTGNQYEIEIVTGGISGIVQCSITGMLGVDSVIGNVTIVSGQPIALGTSGAMITFSFGSDLLALGDKWIVECKNYHTNIRTVIEAEATPQHLESLPGIAFAIAEIPYEDNGCSNKFRCDLSVVAELWIQQPDKNKIQRELIKGLSDIERALNVDVSRGGVAQDTKVLSSKPFLPVPGSPFAALSVEIGIWFDHYIK